MRAARAVAASPSQSRAVSSLVPAFRVLSVRVDEARQTVDCRKRVFVWNVSVSGAVDSAPVHGTR